MAGHLARSDGTPFFWLGDTAWELFHRLDRDEARRYLDDRASKGFTVVQSVVLAELGGLDVTNANGDLPLEDRDPSRPVDAYFEHVDAIVRLANDRGLVVGMLPTWGKYWKLGSRDSVFTPENARSFGRFLGERYREADLVWILGGDNAIEGPEERAIIDAMAAGLAEGDGGAHLMTYHPRGPGRSSELVHDADWLDFHMYSVVSRVSGAGQRPLRRARPRARARSADARRRAALRGDPRRLLLPQRRPPGPL